MRKIMQSCNPLTIADPTEMENVTYQHTYFVYILQPLDNFEA